MTNNAQDIRHLIGTNLQVCTQLLGAPGLVRSGTGDIGSHLLHDIYHETDGFITKVKGS